MPYIDQNVSIIDQIQLPSGTQYYIADRELRNVVANLSEIVAGGVKFIIAWDGTSEPTEANIPAGVEVYYAANANSTPQKYTGTLTAASAEAGAFYLVKSITSPTVAKTNDPIDVYDEYTRIQTGTSPATYTWEKIGDTQLNLTDTVTGVSLEKATAKVIGSASSFAITQPTITLTANDLTATGRKKYVEEVTPDKQYISSSTSVNSGTNDVVTVITGTTSSTNNNDLLKGVSVSNNILTFNAASCITDNVLGSDTTFSATTTNSVSDTSSTGSTQVVTDVTRTPKYLSAAASGANTTWDNKVQITVLTNTTDVSVTKGSV